ncbi:hypothetical protein B2J88_35505 [Rhodococcus sp. SRB_17]|uniref:DUF1876 domain-containing protein n=1 Tax=unclassified Rhodococcus (in: high G+C Gram-positive bacteria) TaxID=192944 RepID=UPI000B9419B4|nr:MULTISPECIES: DUF1876 domain-containing protein [unclassified Rhodococcus (in: high G+C Gram-positive bacteria)]MCJ0903329.1 DUF1876 domain-containing protein [Rhodococcus sp. ARC_M6]NMM89588.1 hypothetical protein [Rhodococcus sp. SRB_17]OYD71039.1 uncharacterized protein DUF1876 [Rhodococcus sp. OK302]
MNEKHWSVDITIDEHTSETGNRTRAIARLHSRDDTHFAGAGFARCNPSDRDVPEIGDELAVARALADLSRQLIEATTTDLASMTNEPIRLTS